MSPTGQPYAWFVVALVVALVAAALALLWTRRKAPATPMGATLYKTTYEGKELTHRVFWKIATEQARMAQRLERNWYHPSLIAMVFAFHAVEAYLNFAGEHLAPDIWNNEQDYFKKQPYRGFVGKLTKVLELSKVKWAPDQAPFNAILDLKELRDAIAHGKPELFKDTVIHAETPDELPYPASKIRRMVTPKDKLPARLADVEQALDMVHAYIAPTAKNDPWFGDSALCGPEFYIGRHSTLA